MSTLDPAKLKVVELRAELTLRGLDAKGNKPVLVKRLKDALEQETQQEIPDTSIADTSTEDLNASQDDVQTDPPDKPEKSAEIETKPAEKPEEKGEEEHEEVAKESAEESEETVPEKVAAETKPAEDSKPAEETKPVEETKPAEDTQPAEEAKLDEETKSVAKEEEDATVKDETKISENGEKAEEETKAESMDVTESESKSGEQRGEKRRRSPSPEKVQKRSKSPIKENEPTIDNNKVQLSWYDSDLHLQIDKKTFLSGKPHHEGAFGYAWAGARATHGIKAGKVFYEVKVVEELKWEDLVRQSDRRRDYRPDSSRRDRQQKDRDRNEKDSKRSRSSHESKHKSEPAREAPEGSTSAPAVEGSTSAPAVEMKEEEDVTEKTNGIEKEKVESKDEESAEAKQEESADDKQPEDAEMKEDADAAIKKDDPVSKHDDAEINEEDNEAKQEVKEDVKMAQDVETKQEEDVEMKPEEDVEMKPEEDVEMKPEEDVEMKPEEDVEMKPEETVEVKQEADQKEKEKDESTDETSTKSLLKHLIRVGWSVSSSTLQLGEAEFSYGYESTGKYVTNKTFTPHGAKFGVGDVIGAYLNITDDALVLSFTVNGELQPEIASIPKSELPEENFALFPHVLARNYSFEVNMGASENPWFPSPADLSDYVYIGNFDDKVEGSARPEKRGDCEVVMMCGLPASGKTHWVQKFLLETPDKQYTVIGNSHLLEKMTVNGKPLKSFYKGRWNIVLDRLMKCVNILVESAALRRRNFIIDQTNVFPSAQRRKMRLFEGFKRRAVVVVVGDDEQAKRRALQEVQDGKDVPDSAILEMKANMSLPKQGNWLDEVSFVELNEEEATAVVQKYNQQGRDAGFGASGNQRSGGRDNRTIAYRWDHSTSRRDYRGGYRDNRYQGNRYDRSRQQGNWQSRRPPPGSWNRDIRRDSRGSSRDYRNNNRSSESSSRHERSGSRDSRSHSGSSYSRNQRSQSSRNQPANWQGSGGGGGNWNYQGNWGGQGGGGGAWGQGNWNQGNWGGGGGQWKGNYGQSGYGQSGYGNYNNLNYYGEYSQNWNNPQGQPQTTAAGGTVGTDSTNAAYNQYSQQASWTQYPQQYSIANQPSGSQQTK